MERFPSDVRSLLNVKRSRWADLQTAEYVGPQGLKLHRVKVNGVEVIVSAATGAVTFRPGDKVLLGTLAGSNNRAIVGLPPTGLGGASAFTIEQLATTDSGLTLDDIREP